MHSLLLTDSYSLQHVTETDVFEIGVSFKINIHYWWKLLILLEL